MFNKLRIGRKGENIIFKANSKKNTTVFSAIRFGNIIGSRG